MLKYLNTQKGIAIYLALIVMFILLSIGLGLSTLLVGQIRIIRGIGNSVVAIYAADTGIERVLYAIRKEVPPYVPVAGDEPCGVSFSCPPLSNGASYTIKIISANATFTINSKGTYQATQRAIEITY